MRIFEPWTLLLALFFIVHNASKLYQNIINIIRAGYYVSWKTCYLYARINLSPLNLSFIHNLISSHY